MSRTIVAALVVVVVAGCGKSKETCKADVAELMQFLRSFDHEPSLFFIGDEMHVLARPELPKADIIAPVVIVGAHSTSYRGQPVDLAGLTERLVADGEMIRDEIALGRVPRSNPPDPRVLYVLISGDATWDRVVAAVQAGADAGFMRPGFVFTQPSTAKSPPRTWVDDKFDAIRAKHGTDGGGLASGLAEITSGIVKSCPPLVDHYGSVGGGPDLAGAVIEGTGPALIACSCDVDLPALRSVMWLTLANQQPTGVLAVELDREAKPLALPAITPWRDANASLSPGARVWLATGP